NAATDLQETHIGGGDRPVGPIVTTDKYWDDQLLITVWVTTLVITSGEGATNLDEMNNLRNQINATTGINAIRAEVVSISGTHSALRVWAVDKTQAVTITSTASDGATALTGAADMQTFLGINAGVAANADLTRFDTAQ